MNYEQLSLFDENNFGTQPNSVSADNDIHEKQKDTCETSFQSENKDTADKIATIYSKVVDAFYILATKNPEVILKHFNLFEKFFRIVATLKTRSSQVEDKLDEILRDIYERLEIK